MANVGSPSSVPRCPGILALFLASLLVACSPLPPLEGRPVSTHLQDTADTQLGKVLKGPITEHPGLSGVYAVGDGRQAFAARALLADAAERSLDVQNYIWHNDMSGTLMFQALLRAAERGVRVRLLLDDNNTSGLDPTLAALDAHPNIEVRLFNPFMQRRWRLLGYATDFSRLNRRMHNKSFTADNQATIVGGRNVGDEYFGAGQEKLFLDLDVIAVGPVVGEVSKDFDRYWASESAYPVDRIVPPPNAAGIQALRDRATQYMTDPAARPYVSALKGTRLVRQLLSADLPFEWVKVRMVSDDPAKGLGKAPPHRMITQQLVDVLGAPEQELELVSPYLVPTIGGVNAFTDLSLSGVKITVLTNSLAATDVAAVHAGYAKRRRALLEAGVTLYEMKPGTDDEEEADGGTPQRKTASPARRRTFMGSSGSSLHAKTFSVDRSRVFVGSFNFDPRSAQLNTEMGFVIDSPTLAARLADAFLRAVPETSYELRLADGGKIEWLERRDGQVIVHHADPQTGVGLRFGVWFLSLLPIDWML